MPSFSAEINKIIAEASKGSKFYENERVKDELLGRKIQATLQKVAPSLSPVHVLYLEPVFRLSVLKAVFHSKRLTRLRSRS